MCTCLSANFHSVCVCVCVSECVSCVCVCVCVIVSVRENGLWLVSEFPVRLHSWLVPV